MARTACPKFGYTPCAPGTRANVETVRSCRTDLDNQKGSARRAGLSRIQPHVQLTRACGPARVLGSGKDEKIQAPGRVLGSAKALTMRLTTEYGVIAGQRWKGSRIYQGIGLQAQQGP